eukprot:432429-Alexandrium_andersonii.AAC.1
MATAQHDVPRIGRGPRRGHRVSALPAYSLVASRMTFAAWCGARVEVQPRRRHGFCARPSAARRCPDLSCLLRAPVAAAF